MANSLCLRWMLGSCILLILHSLPSYDSFLYYDDEYYYEFFILPFENYVFNIPQENNLLQSKFEILHLGYKKYMRIQLWIPPCTKLHVRPSLRSALGASVCCQWCYSNCNGNFICQVFCLLGPCLLLCRHISRRRVNSMRGCVPLLHRYSDSDALVKKDLKFHTVDAKPCSH